MPSTRPIDLPTPAAPPWPGASAPPRRASRLNASLAAVTARIRALLILDIDVDDFALDDDTLHADLVDLFERRDTSA